MKWFRRTREERQQGEKAPSLIACACLSGAVVPMAAIPGPVFTEGVLGPCIGIGPPAEEGKCVISAPADGTVTQCTETGHAVGLACGETEILIHAGIDTVGLAGKGFVLSVQAGDTVRAGQTLLEMDTALVSEAGYDTVVVIIITESSGTAVFTEQTTIRTGERLFSVLPS